MTRNKTLAQKLLCLLALVAFLFGCTFTKTTQKEVELKDGAAQHIEQDFRIIVDYEKVNVEGIVIETNNVTRADVVLEILNAKKLPEDNDALKKLGFDFASKFKKEMKKPADFESFKVIFITRTGNAVVSKSSSMAFVYDQKEL